MAKFLVDANVLSEATKAAPDPLVVDWLRRNERLLAVDPVILGEIRYGILLLPGGRRRRKLENWFEQVVRRIECLTSDARTGGRWAELLAQTRRAGPPHGGTGQPDRSHGVDLFAHPGHAQRLRLRRMRPHLGGSVRLVADAAGRYTGAATSFLKCLSCASSLSRGHGHRSRPPNRTDGLSPPDRSIVPIRYAASPASVAASCCGSFESAAVPRSRRSPA